MADYLGVQPPPTKKARLAGTSNDNEFDFKVVPSYGTNDPNNTYDIFADLTDQIDMTTQPAQVPQQMYQNQPTMTYLPPTRPQAPTQQQQQQTMPPAYPNATMIRHVNSPQPTATMYNSPRPVYPRMPIANNSTPGQNSPMIRTGYNTTPMGTIGKANDPNNNRVFITNPTSQQATQAQQQQSVMIGAQSAQQTVTQTGKPLSQGLPSLSAPQQFNPYQNYSNNPQSTNYHPHLANPNSTQTNGPVLSQTVPSSLVPPPPPSTMSIQQQQQQSTGVPGSTQQQMVNPNGNTATSHQNVDVHRKQFIQKQLVLLLHAHKCQQREKQNSSTDPTRPNPCNLQHCATMKNVLQHMSQCTNHKSCPVTHCVTSRQIILHWKNCTNPQCLICQPLKSSAQNGHGTGTNAIGQPTAVNPTLLPMSSTTSVTVSKEWQQRVTQEMRNCLVQKIISALVPVNEANTMMDKRMVNLGNYARRVENETFDVAINQEEYFHKLAEKIYKIQKELEERREKKRLSDLQNSGKRPLGIDSTAGFDGPPNRTAPSMSTIKSEPMFPVHSSNMVAGGTFTVTNVPADDSLHSLLNGDTTNDIDTKKSLLDGSNLTMSTAAAAAAATNATSMVKQELISPPKIEVETKAKIDATSKNLPKIPVQFTAEELRLHLQPVIDKMIACEDSPPFRQPVDPVLLQIPDYPLIIKNPMDISTMQNKLERGEYGNPLQFCDDAWLMFNNAWLYNKKTTRVYKMCTKLSEIFAEAIDPAMQKLGYCCGRNYVYLPQVMFCYGNQLCCQIPRDGQYYYYNNPEPSRFNLSGDKYTFCAKCFDSTKGDSIFVGDDPAQTLVELPKSAFLPAKNDIQEPEVMINCVVCTRRWHQVCALHLDQIWPEGFICRTCLREHNIHRKENRFTATKLIITDLALHLEKRVNEYLRRENCLTGRVTIRTLAASDKICEVKPRLKKYYQNQVPEGYPYRAKAIFAFQEIDGVDVVLFGMHVQEYDGRSPHPNARRIYFSYLDSVHFFRPKQYRTEVYHEILIGYLDYAERLGYVYAHIWACPPSEGDDYIFHCHPPEQRVPKPKRLQEWYKKMLDKAAAEHVVIDFKDALKDCVDNQVQTALQIPYFEGDFWANIIEESIKELDQEEEDRRKQEVEAARATEDGNLDDSLDADDITEMSDKRKSTNSQKKKGLKKTTSNQRKVAKKQVSNCTDLMTKIFSTMDKHRDAFFVIRLKNPTAVLAPINDTDALIQCDLMDTRDAFLNFARDKHYEFSSLRRAQFSTMALLYELHTSTTDKFTYNCNSCRQQCEVRYHCTECEDFDLCEKCYNTEPKHKHRMERSTPSMVDGVSNGASSSGSNMATTQLQRQQSMQRCIDALLHALNCRNANCVNRSCLRYKQVIQHTRECKGKNSQCNVCKQMIFLCWYHAKTCVDPNCQVPFCTNLKSKIQKQRATSLQTDRRRMQAMKQQRTTAMQSGSSSASLSSSNSVSSYDSASSGKPTVTLIRTQQTQPQIHIQQQAQQQGNWPTANYGKPVNNPMAVMVNRVKSEQSGDDSQRTDFNSNKQPQQQQQQQQQQLFAQSIPNNPTNRMPTTSTQSNPSPTPIQFNTVQQQWYMTNPHPPPNYTVATRARFPQVLPQQQQQQPQQQGQQPQGTPQTLMAPLRSHTSPPAYLSQTGSPVQLQRAPLNVTHARPTPYQSSSQPQQDPSLR